MPKVTIYTDTWGVPHTFLGVTDSDGNEIKRGFGPVESLSIVTDGKVYDDAGHEYQNSYSFDITQEQYDRLMTNIEQSAQNLGEYNALIGKQCTVWAMEMLCESGIINPVGPLKQDNTNDNPLGSIAQSLLMNPYIQQAGQLIDDFLKINNALKYYGELIGGLGEDLNSKFKLKSYNYKLKIAINMI